MKHFFSLIALVFFVFSCSQNPNHPPEASTPGYVKLPKQDRVYLAMEQEFDATRDPATNTVPKNRLLAANDVRERMIVEQNANHSTRTALSGINWQERGPNNVAGRTRAILFDVNDATHNTVFAGGVSGGIWKTTNFLSGTPNWAPINDFLDNLAVSAIVQDPMNASHIYIGTGEGWFNGGATQGLGIFRSTDGGNTFTQFAGSDNPIFRYVQDLIFDNAGNLYAATRQAGVQKFPAGGSSWTQVLGAGVSAGGNDRAADLELGADGSIYASIGVFSGGSVWKSDISNGVNTGNVSTWTDITPPAAGQRMELAVSPNLATSGYIYVLIQSAANNNCDAIYQSTNGGTSWISRPVPTIFDQGNNPEFTRGQAYYDLIAAVDPNDANTVYIGGVDVLRTVDGGATWDQMTTWTLYPASTTFGLGFTSNQEVHADQHAIHFLPGSSSQLVIGNDGGIYYTSDANVTGFQVKPTFVTKNQDYNITQFYGCAMSPTSGSDYFLAGAQDNGSQQYSSAGVNATNQVTGGDGGFCHIDQNSPNVQITSFTNNSYNISTDGFSTHSYHTIGSGTGKFINPTDYDDVAKILYGSHNTGQYSFITDVDFFPSTGSRSVIELGSGQISSVTVSPNTANRVFFGLETGDVVRVDNAHNGTASGTVVLNTFSVTGISPYVSHVEIENGNDNHLLVTYSNFGVNSIWESTNGGTSWASVEGNIPDMPVRWAMFAPGDADQVLIGTDLGVWTTDNLDGGSTVWGPSNSGLGNIRVDMFQHRASDNTIIAASYGRGLYSTNAFSTPNINIQKSEIVNESSADGVKPAPDDCIGYKDYTVKVQISLLPSSNANVSVSVNGSSTATDTEDFELRTPSLIFTPGGSRVMPVTVRVYNDGFQEADETILLDITLTNSGSTNAQLGTTTQATLTIPGSDKAPLSADIVYTVGSGTDGFNLPFRGDYSDAKVQVLYPASELIAQGLSAGPITGLALDVNYKSSTQPYQNFTIKIKKTGLADLLVLEEGGTTVYSQNPTTALGWNDFIFDQSYVWDGKSNLLIGFCFDNTTSTGGDDINCTTTPYPSAWYKFDDGITGCNLTEIQYNAALRPNLKFYKGKKSNVATEITTAEAYVGANQTVNFYDASGNIICTIVNGSHDFGCTTAEIDRSATSAGKDTVAFWKGNDDAATLLAKTIKLTPTNASKSASYSLTAYLSVAEVSNWESKSGNVLGNMEMVKTANPISTTNPANPYAGGAFEKVATTTSVFGTDHTLTASFTTGMSGIGFGIPGPPPSPFPIEWLRFEGAFENGKVQLDWETASESNNMGFEIERSAEGRYFEKMGFVEGLGSSNTSQAYAFQDGEIDLIVGNYYYRLRQIDVDGNFNYSTTINVILPQGPFDLEVSPNPFKDQFNLMLPLEVASPVIVSLYNMEGKRIKTLYEGQWTGTPIAINEAIKNIPEGIYLLKGNSNGKIFMGKIIKLK